MLWMLLAAAKRLKNRIWFENYQKQLKKAVFTHQIGLKTNIYVRKQLLI